MDEKNQLKLIRPSEDYIESYLKMCEGFKSHGVKYYTLHEPEEFAKWKDTLLSDYKNEEKGIYKDLKYIPSNTYWLVEKGEIVGIGNIRHYLDDKIELLGGHIGYAIRPENWGEGYATELLRLLIKKANKLGIKTALITCDLPNKASARVIEKNGGKLFDINKLLVDGESREVCRYIIHTSYGRRQRMKHVK